MTPTADQAGWGLVNLTDFFKFAFGRFVTSRYETDERCFRSEEPCMRSVVMTALWMNGTCAEGESKEAQPLLNSLLITYAVIARG